MAHLITSMGTSPAILTEAIWWLDQVKGISVSGLTCVGTATSLKEAQAQIFEPGGALERLRAALGRDPDWLGPAQVRWATEPLATADNRNRSEAVAMDRAFRRAILETQALGLEPVMACISGGRKTMSSSLQQAMGLLARPQDAAFHVLLDAPDPELEHALQNSGWAFPGDGFPRLDAASAEGIRLGRLQAGNQLGVDCVEVPLVRLRSLLERVRVDLADDALVEALQRSFDEVMARPDLVLDLGTLRLSLVRPGSHFDLGKLSPTEAMLVNGAIQAGRPVQPQAFLSHALNLIDRWEAVGLANTALVPADRQALRSTAEFVFNPEQVKSAFATSKSRFHRKLKAWLKDPDLAAYFTLESDIHSPLAPRPVGFREELYAQRKIRVVPV
jgi:CRISPR-associated protein (TIGR02584 family)